MLEAVKLMALAFTDAGAVLPSVSVFLLVAAVVALLLVLLWRLRASTPRKIRSSAISASMRALGEEAESAMHATVRNAPARLPMPRMSASDLEPSTSLETLPEEAHNASSGSASKEVHLVERTAASPSAEIRSSSRKAASSEYTLEGRDLKEMVLIPAGDFWMGSDDKDENEKPMHKVNVPAFYIDKFPVTNAEFTRFVENTRYTTEAEEVGKGWIWQSEWREVTGACWRRPTGPGSTVEDKMDHPVVLVSWNDARAYCHWAGKRLPTEPEWEKAARGTDARKWPWGNEWDPTRLNSGERGHGTTTPVGYYPNGPSFFGVADMAGNVWEWVDEWYKPYPGSPCKDEDFGEKYRILRGGSWDSFGHNARCANRTRNLARACVNVNGFRCVLPVNKNELEQLEKQRDIYVPSKRVVFDMSTLHIDVPTLRERLKVHNGAYDRQIPAQQIVEMGRSQIEVIQGQDPFLFRSGKKAHSVQEIAAECLQDAETGKYHLRSGHFTQYLKFLGWQSPAQPEYIARGYYPTRDLPYYLALILEYARAFCMGMQILPPSEEVLDAIVVDRRLASLLIRKAEVILNPRDYSEMIFIPEGDFKMGSSEAQVEEALELARFRNPKAVRAWFADEAPMMDVRTDAYLIDKFPVTNEQFDKFVTASGYRNASDWRRYFTPGRESHPVVMVSWEDAVAYARWADKRLPTEAEWEKAARGTDGRKYSWGNRWDATRLNSLEKGPRTTTPVGFFAEGASPYNVMDCLGNVWEWTADPYRPYPHSEYRSDKFGDRYRVFRGGSWNNYQYNNRCSNRHREEPTYTCMSHGFRCARSVTPNDVRRQRPS